MIKASLVAGVQVFEYQRVLDGEIAQRAEAARCVLLLLLRVSQVLLYGFPLTHHLYCGDASIDAA